VGFVFPFFFFFAVTAVVVSVVSVVPAGSAAEAISPLSPLFLLSVLTALEAFFFFFTTVVVASCPAASPGVPVVVVAELASPLSLPPFLLSASVDTLVGFFFFFTTGLAVEAEEEVEVTGGEAVFWATLWRRLTSDTEEESVNVTRSAVVVNRATIPGNPQPAPSSSTRLPMVFFLPLYIIDHIINSRISCVEIIVRGIVYVACKR